MARPHRSRQVRKEVYFSAEEWAGIEKRMDEDGYNSLAHYAREVLPRKNARRTPREVELIAPRDVLNEMKSIGNNLNQIAWNSNKHSMTTKQELAHAIAQIHALIQILDPLRIELGSQWENCPTCRRPLKTPLA